MTFSLSAPVVDTAVSANRQIPAARGGVVYVVEREFRFAVLTRVAALDPR
jgi:hypothetical protein